METGGFLNLFFNVRAIMHERNQIYVPVTKYFLYYLLKARQHDKSFSIFHLLFNITVLNRY